MMEKKVSNMGFAFNETLVSGLCPSGRKKTVTIRIRKTIRASTINTHRHPNPVATKPPRVGASNGESPITSISNENTLALCSTGKKSRTMARAATQATQPPKACKNRSATSVSVLCACIHPMHVKMKIMRPAYNGLFRPKRSSKGP